MICYICCPEGPKPPVSWSKLVFCPHGVQVFESTLPEPKEEEPAVEESTPEVKIPEPELTPDVEIKRSPGRPRKAA